MIARSLSICLWVGMLAAGVRVEFDPTQPETGPFPTDYLTVPDESTATGLRVAMPLPDCTLAPSDCAEFRQLNQLDGFNINTRLTVKFSGAINPDTLRSGVAFVWLDAVHPPRYAIAPAGTVTPINEVVYDAATHTAYARPDEIFESGRRYLIVVTDAVRDAAGAAVEPDAGFEDCINGRLVARYCADLAAAVARARPSFAGRRIVGASLYTTLNAIEWYRRAEQVVQATPARFQVRAEGGILSLRDVIGITLRQQVGENTFQETPLPVTPGLIAQLGVDRVAFGSFESPVLGREETSRIYFHAFLPNGAAPSGGHRVLLAGHGLSDSRFGMPTLMSLATSQGYAVVAMDAFGHGFGPRSSLILTRSDGSQSEIATPGRGIDITGDGRIEEFEGCAFAAPGQPAGFRDCIRQTVIDYRQLLNAIAQRMDFDGDGRPDLNAADVHYVGQSLGGWYGALVTALMPEVTAAVLNVPPGNQVLTLRLSPRFRTELAPILLGNRQPSLLSRESPLEFEEDLPLRHEAVRLRTRPGAAAVQDFFERMEWLGADADAAVFAPHFKQATLGSNPIKRVLIQIALGDRTVPNPSSSALARAANLRERTVVYRHDLARQAVPTLPADPHLFLIPLGALPQQAIGLSALGQVIEYLASGRDEVPDANGLVRPVFRRDLFEIPESLPEAANFQTGGE